VTTRSHRDRNGRLRLKLIFALAFLFGALSVNAQDTPPSSQTTAAKPLTPAQAGANIELDEQQRENGLTIRPESLKTAKPEGPRP